MYEIILKSGQKYQALNYQLRPDEFKDGKTWVYFETTSEEEPNFLRKHKYHSWTLNNQTYTAWLVPLTTTLYCRKIK